MKTLPETVQILGRTIKRSEYEPHNDYATYTCKVEGASLEVIHARSALTDEPWIFYVRYGKDLGLDVRAKSLRALGQDATRALGKTALVLSCLNGLANTVTPDGVAMGGFYPEYLSVYCTPLYAPRQDRNTYDLYVRQVGGIRLLGSSSSMHDGSLDRLAREYIQANDSTLMSLEGNLFVAAHDDARWPTHLSYTKMSVPFMDSKLVAYGDSYDSALKILRTDLKKYLKTIEALQELA